VKVGSIGAPFAREPSAPRASLATQKGEHRRAARLTALASGPLDALLADLEASAQGLTEAEASQRLLVHGPNAVRHDRLRGWPLHLAQAFANPFNVVLVMLGAVQLWSTPGALSGPVIIGVMVALSVSIRFTQEYRSSRARHRLRLLVVTKSTVWRRASLDAPGTKRDLPAEGLVPGDVVALVAGDVVPADLRLLSSKDLYLNQASLTGESLPVEKVALATWGSAQAEGGVEAGPDPAAAPVPLPDVPTLCLMGTSVVSGAATALVLKTGADASTGAMTTSLLGRRPMTAFDVGVSRVSWLMIRFMAVMAPGVFLLNGLTKGDWREAALFALAVAVGLVPEMLPLVVTANLARGAIVLSRQKVMVKHLNAIQNFGAMDVLCTDKTGTLTQDRVVLEQHVDVIGKESLAVLKLAYLNSFHQTGLHNLLDRAVLAHADLIHHMEALREKRKVDEVPFDFTRRRLSVVVEADDGRHQLICKGAVDEVLGVCSQVRIGEEVGPLTPLLRAHVMRVCGEMNQDGMRVMAVASRELPPERHVYGVADERDLVLTGYIGFLDPPRDTAKEALDALAALGVTVKILTGDNDVVARKVCHDVGLAQVSTLLGPALDALDDAQLAVAVERTTLFAKLDPMQKARVVRTLKRNGHAVGFLGDGVNDAAAMREADLGISVDSAVDVAKDTADVILMEKSLMALRQGVIEGRTIFGNVLKYIKMTASSNFGNVLSVLLASVALPFLPMLPLQLLVQNLLYDLSQLSIPWDRMDPEFLRRPRRWDAKGIARFMLCIGPVSSAFDVLTFALLWFAFGADSPARQALFQGGWFVEGLLSQTLIIHLIRTERVPFLQSMAATPVLVLTGTVMLVGLAIPFTFLGSAIGFVPLPGAFFPGLGLVLLGYLALSHVVKRWYLRRFGDWL
jgi:Mg2+-importing ATPase